MKQGCVPLILLIFLALGGLTAILFTAGTALADPAEKKDGKPAAPAASAGFSECRTKVDGADYAFQMLRPAILQRSVTYPCVLFLHGAGERGTDNQAQLKHFAAAMATPEMQAKYPCYIIAPQCLPEKQWVDTPWGAKESHQMADKPSVMLASAMAALDHVMKTEPVDANRVILTGLSMGGYGAWELATRHADRFCCVVPVCGGADESKAAALKNLPVWAWHGAADTVVWPERTERMVAAVNAAGGKAKLSLLPGVGHDSWSAAYAPASGVLDWMFAQRRKAGN